LVFLVVSFPLAFPPIIYKRSSSPPFVLNSDLASKINRQEHHEIRIMWKELHLFWNSNNIGFATSWHVPAIKFSVDKRHWSLFLNLEQPPPPAAAHCRKWNSIKFCKNILISNRYTVWTQRLND
jgi:hypothetical protein